MPFLLEYLKGIDYLGILGEYKRIATQFTIMK
jgi:hypothetical protein